MRNFKEYIQRAKTIHNNLYDYSMTEEPKTCKDKVCIICPKHGKFYMSLDNHVNGKQCCPKCSGKMISKTSEFIEASQIKHQNKYDYSKVNYINAKTKVCIICPIHGEFWQEPRHHLNGVGCPLCSKNHKKTYKEFIEDANKIHNNKYIYPENNTFSSMTSKIEIICPEHGSFFQKAASHLNGCGCPKCKGGTKPTLEEVIKRAKKIHKNKYSYDKFKYINAKTPGIITCPIHGDFFQTMDAHLNRKDGCPKCSSSKLENMVINGLDLSNIIYQYQFRIKELGLKSYDFYLPNYSLIIECQGEQHYMPIKFDTNITDDKANDIFFERCSLDKEKYIVAKKNGLNVIYFTKSEYFHENKTINVRDGFYADKLVFTDLDKLITYIKKLPIVDNEDMFNNLCKDILKINKDVLIYHNKIIYKNNAILFYKLVQNDKNKLKDDRSYLNKRNIKNIVQIFEDEYANNKEIVISKIKHIFHFDNNLPKIMGRKCVVSPISKNDSEKFLNKFHIQGFVGSTIYIGAFYNSQLIAVMSFLNEGNGMWNLTRFASDYNFVCQGVGGKLFHYFIKNYSFKSIKSFADKRWTMNRNDNVYIKLGFHFASDVAKTYTYFNESENRFRRFHKFNFRKQTLHKKYGFPLSMTEFEMTKKLGYVRIWDCGLIKYVYES